MVFWGAYFFLFYYRVIKKNKTITKKEIEDRFFFPSLFLGLLFYGILGKVLFFLKKLW